ncbi:hypothetical protein [Sulfurimonas microaerophilic]|uniref:hypothetical protein n=1 Tax=Sulfurimonas microaerophilic TaxID=3058392 RepID=UPI0027148992|nr:hypothetical protein [Sulfurimonas sp. hsl 1-7]
MLIGVTLLAVETDTNVTFGEERNLGQDQYGNNVYERDVTIETTNFKVDNYWKKFSLNGSGTAQENFELISTSGTVQINVESSFACKDGALDTAGCSGQKPFLLNQNTLDNLDLQKDANGNDLPTGEYRIPFNSAKEYNTTADDAFYPIDVYRDGMYYQETVANDHLSEKPKTFFGFMTKMFVNFFASLTAESLSLIDSPEIRNRYIANITFGLQKDYFIPKNSTIYTNEVNTSDNTKRVSLVDYTIQEDSAQEETCNVFFFTFTSGSSTCKGVSFFGLSSFIPFITNAPDLKIVPAIVAEDTESTLLTLAGKLDGVNYITEKLDPNTGTSFLTEMFKPMSFMFDSMMKFFFGSTAKELTQVVMLDFNFTNPMALTFLETDGSTVTDFKYFTLLGLESVYGTEVEACTVKKLIWPFPPMYNKNTYYKNIYTNTEFDLGTSYTDYSELNITTTTKTTWGVTKTTGTANVSNEDWLDWCMRNKNETSTSWLFDMFSFMIPTLGTTEGGVTYDEQLDAVINAENWKVDEFQSKVHKGLILHLKEIQNGFEPEAAGTTSTYKLMNIQRGN